MYYNRAGEKIVYVDLASSNPFLNIRIAGYTMPNSKYVIAHNISKQSYWDNYTFEYIISGKGYIETETDRYDVQAGNVYFLNKLQHHIYYADKDDPYQKIFFCVKGDFADALMQSYHLLDSVIIKRIDMLSTFERIINLLDIDIPPDKSVYDALTAELLKIVQSLSDISYEKKPLAQNLADRIMLYLENNLNESICLDDISRSLNISKSHIERVFKAHFGDTPHRYLLTLKVRSAARLLMHSNLSVNEIAEHYAFADAKHFSKCFKQQFNLAPLQYRKERRDNP